MFACSVGFRLQIQKAFLFIKKWGPGELHVASHPSDQPLFVVILTLSIFHLGVIRKHIHFFQSEIQIYTDIFGCLLAVTHDASESQRWWQGWCPRTFLLPVSAYSHNHGAGLPPKSAQHSLWTETEVVPATCVTVSINPLTLIWGPHFFPLGWLCCS